MTRTLFILVVLIAAATARAAICTWQGGDGTWSDGARWSCGHEPTAADECMIDASSGGVAIDASGQVHADCGTLDFTGASGVTLTLPTDAVRVAGNATFSSGVHTTGLSNCQFDLTGTGTLIGPSRTHEYAGTTLALYCVSGGTRTLRGPWDAPDSVFFLLKGDFDLDGNDLTADEVQFGSPGMGGVAFGKATVTLRILLDAQGNDEGLSATASTLIIDGAAAHGNGKLQAGGSSVLHDVIIRGTVTTLEFVPHADSLTLEPGASLGGEAFVLGRLACTGNGGGYITIHDTSMDVASAPACDYVQLSNATCTVGGGAPWPGGGDPCVAGAHAVDLDGRPIADVSYTNPGWQFSDPSIPMLMSMDTRVRRRMCS